MCDKQQYTLLAIPTLIGTRVDFPEFPDLDVYLQDVKNRLCPSHYDTNIRCVWEGDLEVTLSVGSQQIVLNDHDKTHNHETIIGDYTFMGESAYVKDHKRDLTFLVFSVCKNQKIDYPPYPTTVEESITRHLNQPFLIELFESPGTGFSWTLDLPPEITLIGESFSSEPQYERKAGAGGLRTFILKGIVRGRVNLRAIYARPWEKGIVPVDPHNVKNYDITIL